MSLNVSVTDFYRRRVPKASPSPFLFRILWFLPSSLLKSRPDRAHSLEYAPVARLACIAPPPPSRTARSDSFRSPSTQLAPEPGCAQLLLSCERFPSLPHPGYAQLQLAPEPGCAQL